MLGRLGFHCSSRQAITGHPCHGWIYRGVSIGVKAVEVGSCPSHIVRGPVFPKRDLQTHRMMENERNHIKSTYLDVSIDI